MVIVTSHRQTRRVVPSLCWEMSSPVATSSGVVDAILGGWQLSSAMFAKSGTGFTPFYDCGDCDPVWPGNIGSSFPDATAGFNDGTFRPRLIGDPTSGVSGDVIFNAGA